jgi:prophage regulatory protein
MKRDEGASDVVILRDVRVAERLSCSRQTVWRLAKTLPGFPQPVKLTAGVTGWVESEINDFITNRVAQARGQAGE